MKGPRPGTGQFSERSHDADGLEIGFLEAGNGRPLLVIHGAGGPQLSSLHSRLASQFRVVLVTLPGFGDSAEMSGYADARRYAELLESLTERLFAADFAVMGTSFGGRVASWLTVLNPRVSALVLLAPALVLPAEMPSPPDDSRFEDPMHGLRFFEPWRHEERRLDAAVRARQAGIVRRALSDPDSALLARLNSASAPALVLLGAEDQIVPTSLLPQLRDILPGAAFAILRHAAHVLEEERPDDVEALVTRFIQSPQSTVAELRTGWPTPPLI